VDILEAYFHNEPRIEEWVEQIIEKIFTACLLTGVDSDAEYQKGCEIVAKLTTLLQGFSTFPSEYLADGLKQIIEQQLPDSRVTDNFPTFSDVMYKMLDEGMLKVFDPQNTGGTNTLVDISKENIGVSEEEYSVPHSLVEVGVSQLDQKELFDQSKEILVTNSQSNTGELVQLSKVVTDRPERLNDVLNHIFPNVNVNWNITLQGQKFLARVGDILICCNDPAHPLQTEKLKKDGWKIMVLQEDDLTYPRRLERVIKNTIRLVKKTKER